MACIGHGRLLEAKTHIWLFEHLTANSTRQASTIVKLTPLAVLENIPLLRHPIIESPNPNYASSGASTRILSQRVRCKPASYRRAPESLAHRIASFQSPTHGKLALQIYAGIHESHLHRTICLGPYTSGVSVRSPIMFKKQWSDVKPQFYQRSCKFETHHFCLERPPFSHLGTHLACFSTSCK